MTKQIGVGVVVLLCGAAVTTSATTWRAVNAHDSYIADHRQAFAEESRRVRALEREVQLRTSSIAAVGSLTEDMQAVKVSLGKIETKLDMLIRRYDLAGLPDPDDGGG